jgi:hypothetical protein
MRENPFFIGKLEEQRHFAARNSAFIKIYNNLCDTYEKVILRTIHAPTAEQDARLRQLDPADPEYTQIDIEVLAARIVYFLGHLSIEDFQELLTLSVNGYGYGALKLLRGLYEKTVTAMYLSKNTKQVRDYADYMFIQAHKIMSRAREGNPDLDSRYSPEYLAELKAGYERAKEKLKETVCRKCGAPRVQLSWSRLDMATMAKQVGEGIDDLLLKCYLEPTAHSHATPLSLAERVTGTPNGGISFNHEPQRDRADLALFYAHRLMIYNIEVQNDYFELGLGQEIVQCAKECAEVWKDRITGIGNRVAGSTPEFQFCVGDPQGRQSTVWKIWSKKGDVHIRSGMMGSEFILHESGACRWSLTADQAKTTGSNDNGDLVWQRPEPTANSSAHVFRIIIPESELCELGVADDIQKVKWLDAPPSGHAVSVECYLTPPSDSLDGASFPYAALVSFQLPDSKWFVALVHQEVMTENNHHVLCDGREKIMRQAMDEGIELSPHYRAVAIMKDASGVSGVIEIVPPEHCRGEAGSSSEQ